MLPSTNIPQKLAELSALLFYNNEHSLQAVIKLEEQMRTVLSNTTYFQINTRFNPKMGESFQVKETPLALILQNGKEVWRQTGEVTDNTFLMDLVKLNNKDNAENKAQVS